MSKPLMAFLGLGKQPATKKADEAKPGATSATSEAEANADGEGDEEVGLPADGKTNTRAGKRANSYEDGDEPDEDDEPEDDEEDEDEERRDRRRRAVRRRNALRAAGERRGINTERARVAAIMNGVDPGKANVALHLALNTDLSVDQVKSALEATPAGKSGGFSAAMAKHRDQTPGPGFAAAGSVKPPSLSDSMKALLDKRAKKKGSL